MIILEFLIDFFFSVLWLAVRGGLHAEEIFKCEFCYFPNVFLRIVCDLIIFFGFSIFIWEGVEKLIVLIW